MIVRVRVLDHGSPGIDDRSTAPLSDAQRHATRTSLTHGSDAHRGAIGTKWSSFGCVSLFT